MNDNETIRTGTKKVVITVFTQAVILGLSFITGFILPKIMGPEEFGYWQIYLFYLGYLNLFGLGLNDGIGLFYGGYEYERLPFQRIRAAMRVFFIYLIVVTAAFFTIISFTRDPARQEIYQVLALSVPSICLQCIVLTVFLSVGKTGVYNVINLLLKVLATATYVLLLLFKMSRSQDVMLADFGVRIFVTVICLVLGRRFLFGKAEPIGIGLQEFGEKCRYGLNITFALIAASFMPVAGRTIVEWNESAYVYGQYAFAMSILHIIVTFTSTAGTVIFPFLKRLSEEKLPEYYKKFSFICSSLIYIAWFAYIPVVWIVRYFMKEYIPVLSYLHILLAMCLPLGRSQLLLTSYFKAYRMEKAYLMFNIVGVAAMLVTTAGAYYLFSSVFAVAVSTTVVMTVWCFCAELYLYAKVGGHIAWRDKIIEIVMMIFFIIGGSLKSIGLFALVYGAAFVVLLLVDRKRYMELLRSRKGNAEE